VTITDVQRERQAVLCGPAAMAALRAERARQARLAAAQLRRDQRLIEATRRAEK